MSTGLSRKACRGEHLFFGGGHGEGRKPQATGGKDGAVMGKTKRPPAPNYSGIVADPCECPYCGNHSASKAKRRKHIRETHDPGVARSAEEPLRRAHGSDK